MSMHSEARENLRDRAGRTTSFIARAAGLGWILMAAVFGALAIGLGFVGSDLALLTVALCFAALFVGAFLLVGGARRVPLIASLTLAIASLVVGGWLYLISGDPGDQGRPSVVINLGLAGLAALGSGAALTLGRGRWYGRTSKRP